MTKVLQVSRDETKQQRNKQKSRNYLRTVQQIIFFLQKLKLHFIVNMYVGNWCFLRYFKQIVDNSN